MTSDSLGDPFTATNVPAETGATERVPDLSPRGHAGDDCDSSVGIVDGDFLVNTELADRLDQLARTPNLLVACDYDGTIAPIVNDPMKALPLRETSVALRNLASLPRTEVSVISGRSLRDLAALSRLPAEIHLVGSHGTEFDIDFALDLDPDLQARRDRLLDGLQSLTDHHDGLALEKKPASAAVHYRNVDGVEIDLLLGDIDTLVAQIGGLTVRHGKMVCELLLIPTDKGRALTKVRANVGASAVLFIGDDVTDEDAFATLAGPDVGVKVGDGDTIASFRVDTPDEVAILLAALCSRRADWLAGAGVTPIEDHSVLSDQRTAAIVTPRRPYHMAVRTPHRLLRDLRRAARWSAGRSLLGPAERERT